jgi:hypothetical protein
VLARLLQHVAAEERFAAALEGAAA